MSSRNRAIPPVDDEPGAAALLLYMPDELKREVARIVEYYNNEPYHKPLHIFTPAQLCHGGQREINTRRKLIRLRTLRKKEHCNLMRRSTKSATARSPNSPQDKKI